MFEECAFDVVFDLMRNAKPCMSAIGANRLHDRPAPPAARVAAQNLYEIQNILVLGRRTSRLGTRCGVIPDSGPTIEC